MDMKKKCATCLAEKDCCVFLTDTCLLVSHRFLKISALQGFLLIFVGNLLFLFRGDPLTDNKCDCECGFTGENCKEKVFCKSKFIFWLCFSSGMLLLLIGVGAFIYFKFIKNDIEERSVNEKALQSFQVIIKYNASITIKQN